MYGGTDRGTSYLASLGGLSPRVRGNLDYLVRFRYNCRSIPACTGEPDKVRLVMAAQGVYPRVYGGTFIINKLDYLVRGLSPRVRGNLGMIGPFSPVYRSIPACTGEPQFGL